MTNDHTLKPLYTGPLRHFPPARIGGDHDPSIVPRTELLHAQRLSQRIGDYGDHCGYRRPDSRALASEWSKHYFVALMVPVVGANLLLGRDLPLSPRETGLELDEDGLPARLWFAHAGKPLSSMAAFGRFDALYAHLEEMIAAFTAASGVTGKVLWSNAGNVFERFARDIDRHCLAVPASGAPVQQVVDSPAMPDGRPNPLFQPVRYVRGTATKDTLRIRRLCCIRYLLPLDEDARYCGSCPIRPDNLPAVRAAGPSRKTSSSVRPPAEGPAD
ncbi:siderophore-iron reductase FhuF [Bordetella genomosp. 13]|nr:siderophore-iron reductase FhuF [Bordetella genomosp. 13]